MLSFEIRILKADGSLSMATEQIHLNADAAVRAARRLAASRPFEVWSEHRCVYSSTAVPEPEPPPLGQPAA
jgi:hypothetical protein